MQVAVVGLWHLGTVTAGCLASAGYQVIGFDPSIDIVGGLGRCRLPVYEPGLEDLIRRGIEHGTLRFSTNREDISGVGIVWVAIDTPVDDNDHADVEFVIEQVAATFPYLREGTLVLISSQLPAGSTRVLEDRCVSERPNGAITFAYSPENLRLGNAIEVFSHPDRIVVGIRRDTEKVRIGELLRPFSENIEWMSVESAEMTKHALNAFLATSVVFINELAVLCERVGANAREVERGLKSEPRIGPRAYLRAGNAFAGGTLARDVAFLLELARSESVTTQLFPAVLASNESHKEWPRRRILNLLGDLRGKVIGMLGLTYKPATDTLRRSSAIETCRWLGRQGAEIVAYDPAVKSLPADLARFTHLRTSINDTLNETDALIISTEWPEFTGIDASEVLSRMRHPIVLDPGRFLEVNLSGDPRIGYYSVGRSA